MRIGCDLDGVLADLHDEFVRTARRLFPDLDAGAMAAPDVGASPPADPSSPAPEPGVAPPEVEPADEGTPVLSRGQSGRIWQEVAETENFWERLKEIESGSVARLATLADQRRWEVMFLTSRPHSAGRTVQRQSQRWLERHGFPLPSLFVVHGSRGEIARALALDVVIDDRPDNCLDVVLESKAGAVLVWRGSAERVPHSARRLGIGVVSSLAACWDTLIEAEESKGDGGLLDRLRRLFGLRTRQASGLLRR